ncbi:MAG: hypothetical protein IPM98_09410 [Lewinellaceae bacterium]|nr:hypothetical protein [Lewinellaceae bacterium]
MEYLTQDPLVRTQQCAHEQGYVAKIQAGEVVVQKKCTHCKHPFWINYHRREVAFCSLQCHNISLNTNPVSKEKRTVSVNGIFLQKAVENKNRQMEIFTRLKYDSPFQERGNRLQTGHPSDRDTVSRALKSDAAC